LKADIVHDEGKGQNEEVMPMREEDMMIDEEVSHDDDEVVMIMMRNVGMKMMRDS
jgi:hypothetical protein